MLVAAALLTGVVGCADRSIPAEPPPTSEPSQEETEGASVEIAGSITALSSGSEEEFLLRVVGKGYLPITIAPELGVPVRQAGVVLAVPRDFDTTLTGDALYDALQQLAHDSGESLRVSGFTDITTD